MTSQCLGDSAKNSRTDGIKSGAMKQRLVAKQHDDGVRALGSGAPTGDLLEWLHDEHEENGSARVSEHR